MRGHFPREKNACMFLTRTPLLYTRHVQNFKFVGYFYEVGTTYVTTSREAIAINPKANDACAGEGPTDVAVSFLGLQDSLWLSWGRCPQTPRIF